MVSARFHPSPSDPAASREADARLNLLLTYGGWQQDPWVERLPRLLEPMGIRSLRAGSAREAETAIRSEPVHIAVVDLGVPLYCRDEPETSGGASGAAAPEAGPRLLDLLARLETPPPTVVVKRERAVRDEQREIAAALKHGAFAVVDRPHSQRELELMLEVLRRCLRRFYSGRWPGAVL
ncbi:MAG: hypothetical protein AAGK04_08885 [Planctomycetota bacterium]